MRRISASSACLFSIHFAALRACVLLLKFGLGKVYFQSWMHLFCFHLERLPIAVFVKIVECTNCFIDEILFLIKIRMIPSFHLVDVIVNFPAKRIIEFHIRVKASCG